MNFPGRFFFGVLVAMILAAFTGCSLSNSGEADEENEPAFLLGKSRVNALDYSGAADAFKESLRANPHSAAAHFQLACLFDSDPAKIPLADPASAIYHYQEFLKLKPQAEKADFARQRIQACKVTLAQDVTAMPAMPGAQKQIEQLIIKNRQLEATNQTLRAEVDQWRTYFAKQPATPRVETPSSQNNGGTSSPERNSFANENSPKAPPVKFKTHVVAKYDTLASIAKKYRVSLTSLQAVNPGVNSSKLRVGQSINLPP